LPSLVGVITVLSDDFDISAPTNATIASCLRTLAVINLYEKNYPTPCFCCGGVTCYSVLGS
jgi:hypothetical protein